MGVCWMVLYVCSHACAQADVCACGYMRVCMCVRLSLCEHMYPCVCVCVRTHMCADAPVSLKCAGKATFELIHAAPQTHTYII